MVEDVERQRTNLGDRSRSVWTVLRVADVDDRLVRQLVQHGPRDCQPSDTAVEDADGRVHAPQCIRYTAGDDRVTRVTLSPARLSAQAQSWPSRPSAASSSVPP